MKTFIKIILVLLTLVIAIGIIMVSSSFIFSKVAGYRFDPFLIIQVIYYKEKSEFIIPSIFMPTILVLAIIIAIIINFFKIKKPLHGASRLSTFVDLKKNNFFYNPKDKPTLIFGYKNGKLVRNPLNKWDKKRIEVPHIGMCAPTGTGKGVGFVVPNLLHWNHSVIVLDTKRENYQLTSGYRKNVLKQDVFIFDPRKLETHKYNPLHYVSKDPMKLQGDLMTVASILIFDDEGIWQGSARGLFVALGMLLAETSEEKGLDFTLPSLFNLLIPPTVSFSESIQTSINEDDISSQCKALLIEHLNRPENSRGSVEFTLSTALNFLLDPIVCSAVSGNDFDLRDFRKKPISLYLGSSAKDLVKLSPLFRLLFEQFVAVNDVLPEHDKSLKYVCALFLDEFDRIGKMNSIADGITYFRGYNILLVPIYQSRTQILGTYGKDKGTTLLENFSGEIVYPTHVHENAESISRSLGEYTVTATSKSKSRGGWKTTGINQSDQRRSVLTTDEIKMLGDDNLILSFRGIFPAQLKRMNFFEDKIFKKRLLPSIPLPEQLFVSVSNIENLLRNSIESEIERININEFDIETEEGIESLSDKLVSILLEEE